jgi:hypothetical protein
MSGGEEGAQAQQRLGCWCLLVDPIQRQRPDGGHPPLVATLGEWLVQAEQLPLPLPHQLQILAQALAGLLQVRGGLLQRQRQVPQQLRQRVQGYLVVSAGSPGKKRNGLVAGQDVDPQRRGLAAPRRPAGGHQHLATATRRHQPHQPIGPLSIVIDQQPALPLTQQLEQSRHHLRLIGDLLDSQPTGQRGQGHGRRGRQLRRNPPGDVVVAGEPVGELQRQLGLADPSESVQGAPRHDRRRRLGLQASVQLLQEVIATHEAWVAGR